MVDKVIWLKEKERITVLVFIFGMYEAMGGMRRFL